MGRWAVGWTGRGSGTPIETGGGVAAGLPFDPAAQEGRRRNASWVGQSGCGYVPSGGDAGVVVEVDSVNRPKSCVSC